MQFINNVTSITSVAEDLVRIYNCITQLSKFLSLLITLNDCSSYNNITMFQNNKIFSIVDVLGVSS